MLMMRKIYDLLYLYKAHLIEVNLNLGGLITIDARWRFIPIKIDLSQRNEIWNNSIEYFHGRCEHTVFTQNNINKNKKVR